MRLALRGFLLLALLYVVTLVGLVHWARVELEEFGDAVVERTSRLVGAEIVAAMEEGLVDQLAGGSPDNRRQMLRTIQSLTARTGIVESVTVVDRNGEIFASDEFEAVGRDLAVPTDLFGEDRRARLVDVDSPEAAASEYVFDLPLQREGELVGYVRLGLQHAPMNRLHAASRRRLLTFAVAGLVLVTLLGVALQMQIASSGRRLTDALEGAFEGERSPRPEQWHEFGDVIRTAGRLGRQLRTERQQSDLADRRLRDLAHIVDVGIMQVNIDREIEYVSETARELLAPLREDGPAEWGSLLSQLEEAFSHLLQSREGEREIEVELVAEEGQQRLRARVVPIEEDTCTGFTILVRDQNVLDTIDTDLRLAARLRNLTSVYLGVAHDLRAPLNAIVLNLELLERDLPHDEETGGGRAVERLEVVEHELDRLQRALDLLLAQARPGQEESDRFDLRDLVDDVRLLLEPQARQQSVDLKISAPERSLVVHGVRDQIKQALLNVAINGLETMPDRGELDLTLNGRDGDAVLTVRDSGPGIPESLRDDIFELHVTSKDDGTGIGLYVARSIFEAHGGSVTVADTGSDGTTFEIRLPVEETS